MSAVSQKIVESNTRAARLSAEADAYIAAHQADERTPEDMELDVARSMLGGRGFSADEVEWWINDAKVRYINTTETHRRFGAKTNQHGDRANGLLIPYFDLDGNPVIDPQTNRPFERIRLSHWDGKGKYRSEAGTTLHAYLPPLPNKTWREVLSNPDEMIAITEGEFKAARSSYDKWGVPTIGIGGVDCLVTRKGGLVPELAGMKLENRAVYIVFDAPMSDRVQGGIRRAANFLTSRKARVKVVNIASTDVYKDLVARTGDENIKMGLDDYLQAGGLWNALLTPECAVELGEAENDNTLLHSLAVIVGKSMPIYVHLDGQNIGIMRKSSSMAEVLAPEVVSIPTRNGFMTKPMFDLWQQSRSRIELRNVVVRPQDPPLSITSDNNWNSWRGLVTTPVRNDDLSAIWHDFVDQFFSHNIESPDTVALHKKKFKQWCANIFQRPGQRAFTSWTFISKEEGIGKSSLLELLAFIIGVDDGTNDGAGAFIADASNLESQWTDYFNGKTFILFNEPSDGNAKMRQKAKNLRTNRVLNCNTKFGANFSIPNIITFAFTTNEPYAFGISEEARRDWVWEPRWRQSDADWMRKAAKFGRLACSESKDSDAFRSAILWELLYNVDLSDYDPTEWAGNSKAKSRAASNSTSLNDSRKEDLLDRVLEEIKDEETNPHGVAWTAERWMEWTGPDYNKNHSNADKKWLVGELEKMGYRAGTEQLKMYGANIRVWHAGKQLWSSLDSKQKKQAARISMVIGSNGKQGDHDDE